LSCSMLMPLNACPVPSPTLECLMLSNTHVHTQIPTTCHLAYRLRVIWLIDYVSSGLSTTCHLAYRLRVIWLIPTRVIEACSITEFPSVKILLFRILSYRIVFYSHIWHTKSTYMCFPCNTCPDKPKTRDSNRKRSSTYRSCKAVICSDIFH